jgi:hypothetical protein
MRKIRALFGAEGAVYRFILIESIGTTQGVSDEEACFGFIGGVDGYGRSRRLWWW